MIFGFANCTFLLYKDTNGTLIQEISYTLALSNTLFYLSPYKSAVGNAKNLESSCTKVQFEYKSKSKG